MEILNEKVRTLRLQRNWTQQHLADACGISLRTVQRIEKYGNASHESIMSLCSVFEVEKAVLSAIPRPDSDALKTVRLTNPLLLIIPSAVIGLLLGFFISYSVLAGFQ